MIKIIISEAQPGGEVKMPKHVLKISSYPENEGFIYCPAKNAFVLIKISFPIVCPKCGDNFATRKDIKFVLRENFRDYGL